MSYQLEGDVMKGYLEYQQAFAGKGNTVYWDVKIVATNGDRLGGFGPRTVAKPSWFGQTARTPLETLRGSAVRFCKTRGIDIIGERILDGYTTFHWAADW